MSSIDSRHRLVSHQQQTFDWCTGDSLSGKEILKKQCVLKQIYLPNLLRDNNDNRDKERPTLNIQYAAKMTVAT